MSHVQPEEKNSRPPLLHTQKCIQTLPHPPFGQSDQYFILLIPVYKQKQNQVTRSIWKWSDDSDATLQDCFASWDWNTFQDSSNGIEEYTTLVTGFINKCFDDVIPTVTVHTYPSQKPWITGNSHSELKAWASSSMEWVSNQDPYKKSHYDFQRAIKQPKSQYRTKIESCYAGSDALQMWQGLQTITDYKGKPYHELPSDASLSDKLKFFYARFEASNIEPCMRAPAILDDCVILLSIADVSKTIKQVHKATGPDGVPGCVHRECADQLASVLTDIFNRSLTQSVIPTCFKQTTLALCLGNLSK